MKLETQFTVPKKELKHLDYFKKIDFLEETLKKECRDCLLYTSPSPRDSDQSRMPSSA